MDARYLFLPLILFAGCSGESDTTSAEPEAAEQQVSYSDALQVFEAEQRKYDQLSKLYTAAVERQTQEAETTDPVKAKELAVLVEKLSKRQAESKERLAVARKVKDEAYNRDHPAGGEDLDKATAGPRKVKFGRKPAAQ
ncbi:MAG TPA: hypothetical protein VHY91_06620 [Pirellulales bacterium]|jgi:hypothetical protein|nr:hypothetical protein [Pirellulales bacterium]